MMDDDSEDFDDNPRMTAQQRANQEASAILDRVKATLSGGDGIYYQQHHGIRHSSSSNYKSGKSQFEKGAIAKYNDDSDDSDLEQSKKLKRKKKQIKLTKKNLNKK